MKIRKINISMPAKLCVEDDGKWYITIPNITQCEGKEIKLSLLDYRQIV